MLSWRMICIKCPHTWNPRSGIYRFSKWYKLNRPAFCHRLFWIDLLVPKLREVLLGLDLAWSVGWLHHAASSNLLPFCTSSRVFHFVQPFRRSCIREGGKKVSLDGVHRLCVDSLGLNVGLVTGLHLISISKVGADVQTKEIPGTWNKRFHEFL